MVRLSIGYPSAEDQLQILKARRYSNPLDDIQQVATIENLAEVQNYLSSVKISDEVLYYIIRLCEETRKVDLVETGVSPRCVHALTRMANAHAVLEERGYVVPEDVRAVLVDVCAHRLILRPQARIEGVRAEEILEDIMHSIKPDAKTVL